MANWCNTRYIFRGKEEDLEACAEVINEFIWNDNQYSTYQLIDRKIGGSLDNQDRGNDFEQAEIETDSNGCTYLQTCTTTSGQPEHGLIEKLCAKFNLTCLYYAEEQGNCIYETNDKEGLYIPDRFVIEQHDRETDYTQTEKQALDEIALRTNKACEDWESAQAIIKEYNNEHEEEDLRLNKITVV